MKSYILIMEDDLILKKESTLKFFNYFKQKKNLIGMLLFYLVII